MNGTTAYRIHRVAAVPLGLLVGLCLLLYACSLEDDRDECCLPGWGIFMEYRYMYQGEDVLSQYIHTLDHYLFDADGRFVTMLPPGEQLQFQPLELDVGSYTMVTIGNASERIVLDGHEEEGLDGFLLKVFEQERMQAMTDGGADWGFSCSELYAGVGQFTVSDEPSQRFLTQLSNIHCQLDVRVEWKVRPPAVDDYRITLQNVPCCYNMDSKDFFAVGGHNFPSDVQEERSGYETIVPLKSQTLTTSFVTLRYTSSCIPSLRVYLGSEAITPVLDLTRAFQQWGWNPDRDTVQHYRIRVTILSDGSVSVQPWTEGEVADWMDGGILS